MKNKHTLTEISEQEMLELEIEAQMDFWIYEEECKKYFNIRHAPTKLQYREFLEKYKFRGIHNIYTDETH